MTDFITQTDEITAHWLTQILSGSGALTSGAVERAEIVRELNPPMSVAACIVHVKYSADATGNLPERFFFKIGRRPPEVAFYQHIAPRLHNMPVVHCYHAHFANKLGISNLLFDDISESHYMLRGGLPATREVSLRLATMLAALHRQWWQHPDLAPNGRHAPILDNLTGFVLKQVQAQFSEFVDLCADRLSDKRRRWYERILAGWPFPLWQSRLAQHRGVTLVHGDTHAGNFSFPHDATRPIFLLDWGLWHINLPTYDLAYMLALRMYPERRARMEDEMLEQYHAALDLDDYDVAQLREDYRLSVVYHTLWPIFWHRFTPDSIWFQHLEQIMSAFDDLGCEELL